jgi:hypothetical protein
MFEADDLKIYRGADIQITPKITITQPTLGQIEEFGEKRYFNAIHTLTAVGADLKWQLWDMAQIDYTKIEDYELFIQFIWIAVSSKRRIYDELMSNPEKYENELSSMSKDVLDEMKINPLQLILKDVDFGNFIPCQHEGTGEIVLYDAEHDITIDKVVYYQIVDVVRKIHGLTRNNEGKPRNKTTKMILIDDARDDAKKNADKPYKSILKPLISALTVKCGMCGKDDIWNMHINAFFDAIKRISRIQDAELLLQGAYSGFASLKGIDRTRLEWAGDL